jgi:hypothetical protein
VSLPTKTFKAARKAVCLAKQTGAQVVRKQQNLAQQGLDIKGDVFGTLCGEIFPSFSVNSAGLMMTLNRSVDPDHSHSMRNPLTGEELVIDTQTQTNMTAGRTRPLQ